MRVALIFGGRSPEHEVSIQSAKFIAGVLGSMSHEVVPVFITRDGEWYFVQNLSALSQVEISQTLRVSSDDVALSLCPSGGREFLLERSGGAPIAAVDVVFPIVHGPRGEDGTLQGLLEQVGIPYVGPGVMGSAAAMDKAVMKRLFREADINSAPGISITKTSFQPADLERLVRDLKFPLFVKPARMGSSVGVSKVGSLDELLSSVELAFRFDSKILIEQGIVGRELECSIFDDGQLRASCVGEVVAPQGFYSYEEKYLAESQTRLQMPAHLDEQVVARIQDLALRAFVALECEGMARVDMFLAEDGTLLVNEVNTLPGFTPISMYPKLCELSGISSEKLLEMLLGAALRRFDAVKDF